MKIVRLDNLIVTKVIMEDNSVYCKIDSIWYRMFAGTLQLIHHTEKLEQALEEYVNNEYES